MDISAFRVDNAVEGRLAQVGTPTSGYWGSTYVDKLFEGFLQVGGRGSRGVCHCKTCPEAGIGGGLGENGWH